MKIIPGDEKMKFPGNIYGSQYWNAPKIKYKYYMIQ